MDETQDAHDEVRRGDPSRASRVRRHRPRFILRIAVVVVTSLATCLAAEGLHRAWLSIRGEGYDGATLQLKCERAIDAMAAFAPAGGDSRPETRSGYTLHPYWGAEMKPDASGVLAYFRGEPAEECYEVVVVGGSVATYWSAAAQGRFKTLLEEDPRFGARVVRILGYAHPAYKQPQQLARLSFLFSLGYRPDAVVNLDGFNETAVALRGTRYGTHPAYPAPPIWKSVLLERRETDPAVLEITAETYRLKRESKALFERARSLHFFDSSLLGRFTAARLNGLHADRLAARERMLSGLDANNARYRLGPECSGPPFATDDEAIADLSATIWFESSLSLNALCRERGVFYLHCLQPALCDPGSKPQSAQELAVVHPDGWVRGVELGYPRLRALGKELVERGVAFADTSDCFAGTEETIYSDSCHFGAKGARLLSERIAAEFLARVVGGGE